MTDADTAKQWQPPTYFDSRPALVPLLICAAFALAGASWQPAEYYDFLRVLLTTAAVFLGARAVLAEQYRWLIAAFPIAFLWAPAAFISFPRTVWQILDVAVAAVLVWAGLVIHHHRRPDGEKPMAWWLFALLWFGIVGVIMWGGATAVSSDGGPFD